MQDVPARLALDSLNLTPAFQDWHCLVWGCEGNFICTRISPLQLPSLILSSLLAWLWQEENLDRTTRALEEALRLSEANEQINPRLLNNMSTLQHMEGNLAQAQALYDSLTKAASLGSDAGQGMSTSMLYNRAARHPEYIDGKVQQARMLADLNQSYEAHDLLNNLSKPAKDFIFATLEDRDKDAVYSLCAAGWVQYQASNPLVPMYSTYSYFRVVSHRLSERCPSRPVRLYRDRQNHPNLLHRSILSSELPGRKKLSSTDTTIINRVEELAKKCKISQIALAWVASKASSPIVGISFIQRLQESIIEEIELTLRR
ncbi:hypothetical protein BDR05DRAFT_1005558 [Suillus weaverae]|nr:hypothetical protein BDR05DRAFT_1005558 [Suillus weaverae]